MDPKDSQRQLICDSCGALFTCYPVPGACWCAEVRVSDTTRTELREKHADCLCPDCLARYVNEATTRTA